MAARWTPRIVSLALVLLATSGCRSTRSGEEWASAHPSGAPLLLPQPRPNRIEAEGYMLGPRDVLTVRVFSLEKARELSTFDVEVDVQGKVKVPFAGTIDVEGKTTSEVHDLVVAGLTKYLLDPQVTVIVREFRSRPVAVTGGVEKGGVFFLQKNTTTVLEALSLAGGLSVRAGTRALVTTPGKGEEGPVLTEVDLVALLLDGDERQDQRLVPGSVVNVLPAEDFYIVGYVAHPGSFPYHRPLTVTQAVGLAGGVDERMGSPEAVTITRKTARGVETADVDLEDIANGGATDLPVLPGDTINVRRTWGKWVEALFETVINHFGFGVGYNL